MTPRVEYALARVGSSGWSGDDDDLVFAGKGGGYLDGSALRRCYKLALERAGLLSLRIHDLAIRARREGTTQTVGRSWRIDER